VAGISVKVAAHYPRRSLGSFLREVSRGHSNPDDYWDEGQNLELRLMNLLLTVEELVAGVDVEMHLAHCGSIVRKTRVK